MSPASQPNQVTGIDEALYETLLPVAHRCLATPIVHYLFSQIPQNYHIDSKLLYPPMSVSNLIFPGDARLPVTSLDSNFLSVF